MTSHAPPLEHCIDAVLPADKLGPAALAAMAERGLEGGGEGIDSTLFADILRFDASHSARIGAPETSLGAVLLTNKRWAVGRTLKVAFMPHDLATKGLRTYVRTLAKELEEYANLRLDFQGFDTRGADIRITFERGGSWSYVGTDNLAIPVNEPTMQLGWILEDTPRSEANRVVKHEFMHAFGFGHEQAHPTNDIPWDAERVYHYYGGAPNFWSPEEVRRQVMFRYSVEQTNFSRYDPDSIMHYPIPADLLLDPSKSVGWNPSLSKRDKKYLGLWYPFADED